jgi:hypothetical protein
MPLSSFFRRLGLPVLMLAASSISAQQPANYCATDQPEESLSWLRAWQANPEAFPSLRRSDGEKIMVPVAVHIVGTDAGSGYYRLDHLMTALCEVNEQFDSVGFHFYMVGKINFIDNSLFYAHDWFNGAQMMYQNNVQQAVNLYFVSDPAGACGYYTYGPDAIALAKSCSAPGNSTVAHELGHYFSLPHTFRGWEGGTPPISQQERVDRSNCNSAGDGFCGTGPDYAPYRWNCPVTGPFTDPNGEEFVPDGTFYMSYSNDACTSRFSWDQTSAMQANLAGPRSGLLVRAAPEIRSHEAVALVEPEDGILGTPYNYTVLKWRKDPNATSYHLSVGLNAVLSAVSVDVITTDTFYILEDLPLLRRHFWKVKPISPGNTCTPYSEVRSFTTSEIASGLFDLSTSASKASVYPNPLRAGQSLQIALESELALDVVIRLSGLDGRVLAQTNRALLPGQNQLDWALPTLDAGMYLLQVSPSDPGQWPAGYRPQDWQTKLAIAR